MKVFSGGNTKKYEKNNFPAIVIYLFFLCSVKLRYTNL